MNSSLLIEHNEISTEISPELLTKLEKKARHRETTAESLVCEAIANLLKSQNDGFYPSGDNG